MNDQDRLSAENLQEMGFMPISNEDMGGKNVYGRRFDNYYWEIRVHIHPKLELEHNNCGYIGLYEPKTKINSTPQDLLDKEEWTEEDIKRADDFYIEREASEIGIVWYVGTVGRLKKAIEGIVGIII